MDMIKDYEEGDTEVLWKSKIDDPYSPFMDIINDVMLPPEGHVSPWEPGQAHRYLFEDHVSLECTR